MRILIIALVLLVALSGCQNISEEQASMIAKLFVSQKVKFFAKDVGVNSSVEDISLTIADIRKEGGEWLVLLNASSTVNGTIRSANVNVTIGKDGKVSSVNGVRGNK